MCVPASLEKTIIIITIIIIMERKRLDSVRGIMTPCFSLGIGESWQ